MPTRTDVVAITDSTRIGVASALATLQRLSEFFGLRYPADCTVGDVYPPRKAQFGEPEGGNTEWTTGFYPGMLWLAGELSGESFWHDRAQAHVASFVDRVQRRVHVNHHDLGFLYTLSCTPAWRYRRDESAKQAALDAASLLLDRRLPAAGIIQSWGDLSDPELRGRAIIDSLMNMPLLYEASELTGDPSFARAASTHAGALARHIVRTDGSTFHTFHWDPVTGEPLRGSTAQGYSDTSCWARGQAWAIYGFTLNYVHTEHRTMLDTAIAAAEYFLSHLPADRVPYWDLVFGDADGEERDSSAGAIAVGGLVLLARLTGEERYQNEADAILDSLVASYATSGDDAATCLLRHGVYFKGGGNGVDEGNLWGDYFYLEALQRRANPDWMSYWEPGKDGEDMWA